jgi:hypothetical protein
MTVLLDLFSTEQGGLSVLPSTREIRTVAHHKGETYSCFIWFDEKQPYVPGTTVTSKMEILVPDLRKKFKVGDMFALWQGKVFAVGMVQQTL